MQAIASKQMTVQAILSITIPYNALRFIVSLRFVTISNPFHPTKFDPQYIEIEKTQGRNLVG